MRVLGLMMLMVSRSHIAHVEALAVAVASAAPGLVVVAGRRVGLEVLPFVTYLGEVVAHCKPSSRCVHHRRRRSLVEELHHEQE